MLSVSTLPQLALTPGQIDLWLVHTDHVEPDLAARYHMLLTPQERAQQSRFYFEKDRHRYLVTRALVREVLSRYTAVPADAWRFEADSYGRPHVVEPVDAARQITFNISHTEGLVVLGIRLGHALGIDTESVRRGALLDVAETYFSAQESQRLCSLPPQDQAMRFWELWTLKESYIKARGMGLSLPLDEFSFDLDLPGHVAIEFAPGFEDQPSRWQFWQLRPTDHHLLSICAEVLEGDGPIRLNLRETVPLSFVRAVHCAFDRYPQHPLAASTATTP